MPIRLTVYEFAFESGRENGDFFLAFLCCFSSVVWCGAKNKQQEKVRERGRGGIKVRDGNERERERSYVWEKNSNRGLVK